MLLDSDSTSCMFNAQMPSGGPGLDGLDAAHHSNFAIMGNSRKASDCFTNIALHFRMWQVMQTADQEIPEDVAPVNLRAVEFAHGTLQKARFIVL